MPAADYADLKRFVRKQAHRVAHTRTNVFSVTWLQNAVEGVQHQQKKKIEKKITNCIIRNVMGGKKRTTPPSLSVPSKQRHICVIAEYYIPEDPLPICRSGARSQTCGRSCLCVCGYTKNA